MVRATGGLDDTVEETPDPGDGTGFKFHGYRASEFLHAIDRGLGCFADRSKWLRLMENGMRRNYSWVRPAAEYGALYESVARRRS